MFKLSLRCDRLFCLIGLAILLFSCQGEKEKQINFLVLLSDNHYYSHLGCYDDPVVKTPAIDALAATGVRFANAFCASPSCTPARGAMLAGQDIWRLGPGGNLWSSLSAEIPLYTDLLAEAGYHVGHDRKGWGPGDYSAGGRMLNPAGKTYEDFGGFLKDRNDQPWCYLLSSRNPHRPFTPGAGAKSGMNLADIDVPPYLPDVEEVRSDIADYYEEIQQFDLEVAEAMEQLAASGGLENTVVIICADNGWMMPRGLANLYDFGTRVPLVISYPAQFKPGRVVTDFASLNDLAPTILEMANLSIPKQMTAKSLMPVLTSDEVGRVDPSRNKMVMGRERHAISRAEGLGYPGRCIRTDSFLFIENYTPDRWPAGDPPLFGDIDLHMLQNDCPTKEFMMEHRENPSVKALFDQAFMKRPRLELFDLRSDPFQMKNVADDRDYQAILETLKAQMETYLRETEDPRMSDEPLLWDTYPYYKEKDWVGTPRPAAQKRFGLKEEYPYR